ncbi:MAG: hypothetical protein MUO40_14595 [Anaerolineaceae bacterium]|nr:hypothetical protein [Anaerolineaceae bacterium]
MPRTLKVILIIIAALAVLALGYAVINIVTGGSLDLIGKPTATPLIPTVAPTPTPIESFPTPPPLDEMEPTMDPTGDEVLSTRVIRYLPPVELGTPCTRHGVSVTVFGATRMEMVSGFSPMVGNVYMSVDAEIKNVYWSEYEYLFVYLGFTDESGQSYYPPHPSPDIAPPPTIGVGTLASGESIRGNIILEVPEELTSGTFIYMIETSAAQSWCQFTWEE